MNGVERSGEKSPVPQLVIILVVILVLIAIPVLFLIRLQLPPGFIQREGAEIVQIPEKIHSDREIVVSADRVTLYVPEDATDLTGNFVVSPRQPDLHSFASEPEWSRPIVVDIEYRNEEGVNYPGITFSKPVSICFTLTPKQWNDFTGRPNDFQVQYFDGEHSPSRWVSLPMTMDPEENELCGQTDHFSIYALAIKAAEVIPVFGLTLTPTVTPSPTVTVLNTEESRRNRNDLSATPIPSATNKPPLPTETISSYPNP